MNPNTTVARKPIDLTATEFKLLTTLLERKGVIEEGALRDD